MSCFFNFCNNCLFVEVSNNEELHFLTSNSCFFNFGDGGSMNNAKVYQGFHDGKRLKSTGRQQTYICVPAGLHVGLMPTAIVR